MSEYVYHSHYWHIRSLVTGKPVGEPEPIEERDTALETLLRSELRSCGVCFGIAGWIGTSGHRYECWKCDGGGVVCAWCGDCEDRCSCGSNQ